MTDSVAVLEDSYSEVIVNVIDLALNWQLFSDVGRPRRRDTTVPLFSCPEAGERFPVHILVNFLICTSASYQKSPSLRTVSFSAT